MKSSAFCITVVLTFLAPSSARAQDHEQPLLLKTSGYLEIGAGAYQLTDGYPNRSSGFVRGELHPAAGQRWNAEITRISEFGDSGTLFVVGYEKEIGRNWITQVGAASSNGGVTLPRLRLDFALGHKWLEQANLVTTLGFTSIQAKDEHRDHALQFSTAYFFEAGGMPCALEGGVRHNISSPGAVGATSYYAAVTRGREKERVTSLRLGTAREAYQLVGDSMALVGFPSDTLLLTWREWLDRNSGFQLRLDGYRNPYYSRRGIEAAWFRDF